MTIHQRASFDVEAAGLNATSKTNPAVAKMVAAWENKNAKRAMQGSGLALMAMSLTACGGSSTTTATTTTTTTTTTVTPVAAVLTIGNDVVVGTTAADTVSGARIDSVQTWTGGDKIAGSTGDDTLTATIAANVAPTAGAVTGVENLVITNVAGGARTITFSTATVDGIAGVTSITNMASTAASDLVLTRVLDLAEINLNATAAATTVTYADTLLTGTADTLTLNVNGNTGAVNIGGSAGGGAGFEKLVINATGVASTFSAANLDAAAATVTITGDADLDINGAAVFPKMTTFDSTGSTGDIDLLLGADTVTGTADAKTLTFGSGADDLDLGALAPTEIGVLTVTMGAGNDAVDLDDYADATMVISGGLGTDTLTTAATIAAANGTTISGFETLSYGANAGTQSMADISGNTTFTKVVQGAATITVTNMATATNTIELVGGVATAAGTYSRLIDGAANSMSVVATTADFAFTGNLSAVDEETITFDSNAFNLVIAGDLTTTDLTSVVLVGDNLITLGADGSKEFSSTKIATIDASGVTGTEAVNVFAINNTVAMTVTGPATTGVFTFDGGSGADTVTAAGGRMFIDSLGGDDILTGGTKADDLDGGLGNDTITGGGGADYILGGAGVDTIDLTETTAASDEVEIGVGAANYDVITGFLAGAGTGADNFSALDGTHAWQSTDGTSTVALQSGATLKAADAAGDSTIATISTNVAANTFDNFVAGTITEADMEAAVITALGLTGALDAAANILVFVDDGEDTGVFYFNSADTTDNAVAAAEIEIMAILDGVADATTILAGDILFA